MADPTNTDTQIPPDATQTQTTAVPDPAAAAPETGNVDAPATPGFTEIDGIQVPNDLSQVKDPDMRELYESLTAQQQAEKGTKASTTDQTTAQPKPAGTTEQPQPQTGQQPGPMIPKARFDEVRTRAQQAELDAAYWKGVANGARGPAQGGTQDATQQTTQQPADPLAEITSKREQLAKDFDDGKLTAVDWEKQRTALDRQEREIHDNALLARVPKNAGTEQQDLLLEERTADIAAKHPYSALVFPEAEDRNPIMDARRGMLQAEAQANVSAQHPNLTPGPRADLLYRAELARLTDVYGPAWFPNHKPAATTQAATPPQTTTQTKPLSTTQQNRLDKLVLAGNQPPSLATTGRAPAETGITEAQIMGMSEDQLAKLPPGVLEKMGS